MRGSYGQKIVFRKEEQISEALQTLSSAIENELVHITSQWGIGQNSPKPPFDAFEYVGHCACGAQVSLHSFGSGKDTLGYWEHESSAA
jgi:hypothetical protein